MPKSPRQDLARPKHGDTIGVEHEVKLTCDYITTVSDSKLAHIRDLAEGAQQEDSLWGPEKAVRDAAILIIGVCGQNLYSFSQLTDFVAALSLCAFVASMVALICCYIKEHRSYKRRVSRGIKLMAIIDEIISR
ncbi:MAG: hypothetical protein Q8K75_06880 [Chlamydiales bacterium]|nr:hypothetical protein [Chlamydiales bacterium]